MLAFQILRAIRPSTLSVADGLVMSVQGPRRYLAAMSAVQDSNPNSTEGTRQ